MFDPHDPQQIETKLQKLQTSHPNDADIQVLLGRFHASQLNFSQAEQDYKAALDVDANNAETHFRAGISGGGTGSGLGLPAARPMPEAVERLRAALKLLDDKDLMLKPDNQLPW